VARLAEGAGLELQERRARGMAIPSARMRGGVLPHQAMPLSRYRLPGARASWPTRAPLVGDNLRRPRARRAVALAVLARGLERRWQDDRRRPTSARGGAISPPRWWRPRAWPARQPAGGGCSHNGGAWPAACAYLRAGERAPAIPAQARVGAALVIAAGAAAWPYALGPAYRLLEALVHLP
jgi:hypothetical protein